MSEKKPEEEFDWTQALADWASTTFAPEPPERKRSAAPAQRSRAPSIPPIDPALLPELPRPGIPAAFVQPAETPAPSSSASVNAVDADDQNGEPVVEDSGRDADADDTVTTSDPPPTPEPSTRTLYRSSASLRSAPKAAPSSSNMLAASPAAESVEVPRTGALPAPPGAPPKRLSPPPPPLVPATDIATPTPVPPAPPTPVPGSDPEPAPEPDPTVKPALAGASPPSVLTKPMWLPTPVPAPVTSPDSKAVPVETAPARAPSQPEAPSPAPPRAAPRPAGGGPAAIPPSSRRSDDHPPAASVGLRPAIQSPGAASTLGALLGSEPSDDELDALLDGFPNEEDPSDAATREQPAIRGSADGATKTDDDARPTAPPPSDELHSGTRAEKPVWPSDEEEPTAVRALPTDALNAIFGTDAALDKEAANRAKSPAATAPLGAPAPAKPDSVTAIRASTPSMATIAHEPVEGDEDAVTATKLPTPPPMNVAANALKTPLPLRRPPTPAAVSRPPLAPAPAAPLPARGPSPSRPDAPDSVTALRLPTPAPGPSPFVSRPSFPATAPAGSPAHGVSARGPAPSNPDVPPESVTGLHRPTPIGGLAPMSAAAQRAPSSPDEREMPRAPTRSDAELQVSSSIVDVSELPELEELGPADGSNPDFSQETTWGPERPASTWLDGDGKDAFAARAAWLEDEARRTDDRAARARLLLVVSELRALMGDEDGATQLAREARDGSPQLALAHRQLRALSGTTDGGAFLENIDHSLRATANPAAKMHDALLAADSLRLAGDEDGARKRYEQAARIGAQDARLLLGRAGMALARGETASIALRIPEAEGLTPFSRAATAALRLRGVEVRGAHVEASPAEAIRRARSAIDKGDLAKATSAIESLASEPALRSASTWLAAAMSSVVNDGAKRSIEHLRTLADSRAKRWLAARGLELGDPSIVSEALANQDAFTPPEQLVLLLLSGAAAEEVRMTNSVVATLPEMAPLAAAASGLRTPLDGHVAGDAVSKAEVHLGRLLATDAAPHAVASAVSALAEDRAGEVRALSIHAAHVASRFGEIAAGIVNWGGDAPSKETALAAALVAERGGDTLRARDAYRALAKEDPGSMLALRALASLDEELDEKAALGARARALGSGIEAAVAEIELYARLGATEEGVAALERATQADPSFAVPFLLLERAARQRGDLDRVLAALRGRRAIMGDPMETALDGVREALLVADTEPERAAEILLEAHRARPDDVALRELYERLTVLPPEERAAWREARAQKGTGTARTLWQLEASQLYAHAGDVESALRVASVVAGPSPSGLARLALEEAELAAGSVSRLSDELMSQAKEAADPTDRREAYERLAEVDSVRHDASSALLWHRSVLEESPEHLPSLRYLEHVLVGDARDEELEPLATTLAKRLVGEAGSEGIAHAFAAAWLRSRAGEQGTMHELADLVRQKSPHPPPLWALRSWNAHARATSDYAGDYDSCAALLERTQRPSEQASLAMRMGDAALRMGRQADACSAYERATALTGDLAAWEKLAEARRAMRQPNAAAEALEAAARTSQVREHQLSAWHGAAVLWSDEAHDDARARTTLEQAAKLDLSHGDVFARLSSLYAKTGAKLELADLLEKRSAMASDENDRLALEVERGRLLTEIGEPAKARAALQAALTIQPDHAAALDAYADLCVAAGDYSSAEQSWVRLARLLATPEEQRAVYHKLGTLYADHLGNLSRAELSFREVLKRSPGDVPTLERLVGIYSKQNDAARALEIQTELVGKAESPIEKRDRMMALSSIFETTSRDLRKAEQTLEAARRELPQDVTLLRALAEFYTRHRQMPAVHILLDRTAGDVRRALASGRFAPAAFEIMTAVYELRGYHDAAKLVGASLSAIEGQPAPLPGAEARAGDAQLDDLLAPELISSAFRALLARSGEALDVLAPVDLKALKAAQLPPNHPVVALAAAIGHGMGIPAVNVHVSAQLGMMCVPVSTAPPAIVVGEALIQSPNAAARGFLFVRALKLIQARCGALVRIPPKDAAGAIGGYFRVFNPTWEPPGVPAALVSEATRRIQAAMPRRSDPDAGLLALEAAGSVFQQPQAISPALLAWANRTALLAVGDPNAALDAMAWSQGMPAGAPTGEARSSWITRTAEAREVLVFSLSDAYAEARKRCGLGKK